MCASSFRCCPIPIRLRPHGPAVFSGRLSERNALDQVLSDVTTAGRQAAFVTGEPGIGKTRLVSEFAAAAHAAIESRATVGKTLLVVTS